MSRASRASRVRRARGAAVRAAAAAQRTVLRGLVPAVGRLPKDDRLVLFGAMNGTWYGDNSRHLYEWVLAHRPDVRAVWMTRDRDVYRRLRAEGRPVALSSSPRGIRLLWRARAAAFSNSLRDIAPDPALAPRSLRLLALRHGRPVKRVRFARLGHQISAEEARARRQEGDMIDYAISTSEFISDLQEECLRIGRDKHVVTGYPRNDALIEVSPRQRQDWQAFLAGATPRSVALYAPSWRHGREPTRFFPFDDFSVDGLVDALRAADVLLLMRPHVQDLRYPALREMLTALAAHPDCVRLATHEQLPDVNSFLPFVDVLVSDYSALYHDFLLLDRPILFVPYDYEEFERQNGFLYDYFANLPGPAIDSFARFRDALVAAATGDDEDKERRRALRDRVHTFQDARSCERTAALLDRVGRTR